MISKATARCFRLVGSSILRSRAAGKSRLTPLGLRMLDVFSAVTPALQTFSERERDRETLGLRMLNRN